MTPRPDPVASAMEIVHTKMCSKQLSPASWAGHDYPRSVVAAVGHPLRPPHMLSTPHGAPHHKCGECGAATTKPGDLKNEIRFLIRHGKLASDGLLVTKGDSNVYVPGEPREKIIVPHNVAPGTLQYTTREENCDRSSLPPAFG